MPASPVNTVSGQVAASGRPGDAPPPYSPRPDVVITNAPSAGSVHHLIYVEEPLRSKAVFTTCPHCNKRVYTVVKHISTNKTHFCAGLICGMTSWCFICCLSVLPYYMNSCKRAEHYCPTCEQLLGSYSRM